MFSNTPQRVELYSGVQKPVLFMPANALLSTTWPSLGLFENGEWRWRAEIEVFILIVTISACMHSSVG